MRELTGLCPFSESYTIPHFASKVYRCLHLPGKRIQHLPDTTSPAFTREKQSKFALNYMEYLEFKDGIEIETGANETREPRLKGCRMDGRIRGTTVYFEVPTNDYNNSHYYVCIQL